jgi:hypothetical protein
VRVETPATDSHEPAPLKLVDQAGRQLRAPWAASIAGLLFAGLFTAALVILRTHPLLDATDLQIARLFATGDDIALVIAGLYLAPIAGIAFLWFVAVIRDQIGDREDRFFATVFLASGIIFVSVLFVADAVAMTPVVEVRYLGMAPPSAAGVDQAQGLAYTLLFAFGTRAAGVFLLATATIGIRSRAFPRWFALTGYVIGVMLLIAVTFWDWIVLVLPAWVGIVSLFLLRRERSRRKTRPGAASIAS